MKIKEINKTEIDMASITMKNLTKIYEEREVGFFKKKKEEKRKDVVAVKDFSMEDWQTER